jgi:branched-chain amino acid transport system permease protein
MNRPIETAVRWLLAAALFGAAIVAWRGAGFFGQSLIAETAIFALFAMSVDLLAGCAGLMSLGQALYFGLGAYGTAVLTTKFGLPALAAMPIAMALAGLLAAVIGAVIVRFGEIIFIMLTLAAGEMLYAWVFANRSLGGSDGLPDVPRADLTRLGIDLGNGAAFTLATIVIAALAFVLLDALLRSPWGLVLAATRQNPDRAAALGANVLRLRNAAYALSAILAALAGSLLAQLNHYASPDLTGWTLSGIVLIMVIFGGLGSLSGGALGAAIIHLLRHYLPHYTDQRDLVLGLIFIAVVLFAENGVFALLLRAANAVVPRRRRPC